MIFLRKQSPEEVPPVEETKVERKLTKKQKLKLKKLQQKEQIKEKRRTLLREHLARELKYGLYTFKKHEQNWMKMLLQLSLPYHRETLQYTWQSFERLIDVKDFIISCLLDEMREQEDQYMRDKMMHVTRVYRMVEIFHEQLKEMHENFLNDVRFEINIQLD